MPNDHHENSCRCWSCWAQENFTAVALFFIVIIGLGITVWVMHEPWIDKERLTFLEGFVGGAFSTWTLALRTNDNKPPAPNPLPPDTKQTTTRVTEPATPATAAETPATQPQE